MNQQELKNILELHRKWVMGEKGGSRADLTGADLTGADLTGANLTRANLTGADLTGAYLTGAYLTGAYLTGANLTGAYLTGAYLTGANLTGAYLTGANLTGAYLTGADLTGADLTGAYLTGADLTGADLTRANLTGADLTGANLTRANLTGADLTGAYLTGAKTDPIKSDFLSVLAVAEHEVLGLYDALMRGKIDGTVYEGECACLVGTIANVRQENYGKLGIELKPDSNRAAERWFLAIRKGDLPQNNQVSEITAQWMREFMDSKSIKYPRYEITAVMP